MVLIFLKELKNIAIRLIEVFLIKLKHIFDLRKFMKFFKNTIELSPDATKEF